MAKIQFTRVQGSSLEFRTILCVTGSWDKQKYAFENNKREKQYQTPRNIFEKQNKINSYLLGGNYAR